MSIAMYLISTVRDYGYLKLIISWLTNYSFLQLSDKGKNEKEEELKSNEAVEAMNAMKHAADLIVKMDENLKEEEDILHERAIRLRRQSADAFKLMDDVKKLQKYNPLINTNTQFCKFIIKLTKKWYSFPKVIIERLTFYSDP